MQDNRFWTKQSLEKIKEEIKKLEDSNTLWFPNGEMNDNYQRLVPDDERWLYEMKKFVEDNPNHMTDSEMLDFLDSLTGKNVDTDKKTNVILRDSLNKRGWRLHETSSGFPNVRLAIEQYKANPELVTTTWNENARW